MRPGLVMLPCICFTSVTFCWVEVEVAGVLFPLCCLALT